MNLSRDSCNPNDSEGSFDDITGMLGEELHRLGKEADAILDSIRNDSFAPTAHGMNHLDNQRDNDDDKYDGEVLDDEINYEIFKLKSVTANLRQDLDDVSMESMRFNWSSGGEGSYRYPRQCVALENSAEVSPSKELMQGSWRRNASRLAFVVWSVMTVAVACILYVAALV